jgi:hypothetical protein
MAGHRLPKPMPKRKREKEKEKKKGKENDCSDREEMKFD